MKSFLEGVFYSPDLGGAEKYELYRAYALGYLPLTKTLFLCGRADALAAPVEVHFYQLSFIEMRGIPFFRHQADEVGLVESEVRWNGTPRWALVAFAGSGKAEESASAWGLGVRRLMARRLGIYMGIDVARGPEETAFYIQAGSAWR